MRRFSAALVAWLVVQPAALLACNVPVFRYALERWRPEPYEITIFHDGSLSAAQQKIVQSLEAYVQGPDACPTNVALEVVDVEKQPKVHQQNLLKKQKNARLPWLVVRYPEVAGLEYALYEGPLEGAPIEKLFDSPLRRDVAKRLLGGATGVWILLESGNKHADDEKHAWLKKYLTQLEKELKLPELTGAPDDKLLADVKLKIEFSLIRLGKDNTEEAALINMLMHLEEDLDKVAGPWVFPVIGRGLVLPPLAGLGIRDENVLAWARFMVGPCSCEVKRQNPGVDLLMTAAWDDLLQGRLTKAPEVPPLTSLVTQTPPEASPEPTPVPVGLTAVKDEVVSGNHALWRNLVIAAGGCVLLVLVASLFIFARGR